MLLVIIILGHVIFSAPYSIWMNNVYHIMGQKHHEYIRGSVIG